MNNKAMKISRGGGEGGQNGLVKKLGSKYRTTFHGEFKAVTRC